MSFLLRPISYLFIIFLTYFLKRMGLFPKELASVILKIIMNITLPAVAVTAFADFNGQYNLLLLILVGLFVALGSYLLMFLFTLGMEKTKRTYYLICVSGYNVGCYGMPIINSFYGAIGSITSILFDVGNGFMISSGNYALTTTLLKTEGEGKISGRDLLKRFVNTAIVVYLIMLVICVLGIPLPDAVYDFVTPLSNANAFLSMFMVGLLFTLPRQRSDWKSALQVIGFRLAVNGAVAALLFFVLPLPLEIRQITVLLLLCPMGSFSPTFIERCHGDGELAAFTYSITTIVSLALMSLFVGVVFTL